MVISDDNNELETGKGNRYYRHCDVTIAGVRTYLVGSRYIGTVTGLDAYQWSGIG